MEVFISTLNQTAFLFTFIAIGFALAKTKQIPKDSAAVLSKLENMLFIPALVGGTFMKDFTVERLYTMWKLLLVSSVLLAIVVPIVLIIVKLFTLPCPLP